MRVYQEELENYRIVEYIIDFNPEHETGDPINVNLPFTPRLEHTIVVVRTTDTSTPATAIAAVVAEIASQNHPAAIAIASQEGEAIIVYSRIRWIEPGCILEYEPDEWEWEWINL